MNPDLNWWTRLGVILATETTLIVAAAACLSLRWRSATERQLLWRAVMLGLLGVCGSELLGMRPDRWAVSNAQNRPELRWTVQIDRTPGEVPTADTLPPPPLTSAAPETGPAWWPGWIWLAGTVLLVSRTLAARLRLAWKCRGTASPEPPDAETHAHIDELRAQLDLRPIQVRVWPGLQGPIVFGLLRPTLVIPADFQSRFSAEQRRAILAHELSHLAASDPAWLAVAQTVTAVLWWQPLAWWAARELRRTSEAAADEASDLIPGGRVALAESLLLLGRAWTSPLERERLGAAGTGPKSQLAQRIHALLEPAPPVRSHATTRRVLLAVSSVCFAALLLVPLPGLTQPGLARLLTTTPPDSTIARGPQAPDLATARTPSTTSPALLQATTPQPLSTPTGAPLPFPEVRQPSLTLELPPGTTTRSTYVPLRSDVQPTPAPQTPASAPAPAPDPAPTGRARPRSDTTTDTSLATRSWRVDSRRMLERLNLDSSAGDEAATATAALRQLLAAAGVEIPPVSPTSRAEDPARRALFFRPGPGPGTLFARATPNELDRIGHEIDRLNRLEDQVHLVVHFIELNAGGSEDTGLDGLFRQSATDNPAPEITTPSGRLPGTGTPFADRIQIEKLSTQGQAATLSETQFSALRQRLESRGGTDWMTAPGIVTVSGRQAQVAVQDVRSIVTGPRIIPESATNSGALMYEPIQVGIGPVVEVSPEFTGQGWKLVVTAQVDEFMGYADPGGVGGPQLNTSTGALRALDALPRFRTREVVGTGHLTIGQTLILRGPEVPQTIYFKDKVPVLGDIPLLGRLFRKEGKQSIPKRLYVLVTIAPPAAPGQ